MQCVVYSSNEVMRMRRTLNLHDSLLQVPDQTHRRKTVREVLNHHNKDDVEKQKNSCIDKHTN